MRGIVLQEDIEIIPMIKYMTEIYLVSHDKLPDQIRVTVRTDDAISCSWNWYDLNIAETATCRGCGFHFNSIQECVDDAIEAFDGG